MRVTDLLKKNAEAFGGDTRPQPASLPKQPIRLDIDNAMCHF